MKRVCVCISGQFRSTVEGLVALKRGLEGTEATVILSTWNRVGRKSKGAMNVHQLERVFDSSVLLGFPSEWYGWTRFNNALPGLILEETDPRQDDDELIRHLTTSVFPKAIIDIEPSTRLDLSFDADVEDTNSLRLLYKAWRANEIKRQIEKASQPFDLVIRIRPDSKVTGIDVDQMIDATRESRIFTDVYAPDQRFVGDHIAVGSSASLDKYANLFGYAIEHRANWKLIHSEIYNHFVRQELRGAVYPHWGGLIQDVMISSGELLKYLRENKSYRPTIHHHITASAMDIVESLTSGNIDSAIEKLSRLDGTPGDRDGYFSVAGDCLLQYGMWEEALLCLVVVDELKRGGHGYAISGFHNKSMHAAVSSGLGSLQIRDDDRARAAVEIAHRIRRNEHLDYVHDRLGIPLDILGFEAVRNCVDRVLIQMTEPH